MSFLGGNKEVLMLQMEKVRMEYKFSRSNKTNNHKVNPHRLSPFVASSPTIFAHPRAPFLSPSSTWGVKILEICVALDKGNIPRLSPSVTRLEFIPKNHPHTPVTPHKSSIFATQQVCCVSFFTMLLFSRYCAGVNLCFYHRSS